MKKILDHESDSKANYYAVKAFQLWLLSFLFFCGFTFLFFLEVLDGYFIGIPLLVNFVLSGIGLIRGIQSFQHKEEFTSKKVLGLGGNLIIVVVYMIAIIAVLIGR